jgi:hypothetical protein
MGVPYNLCVQLAQACTEISLSVLVQRKDTNLSVLHDTGVCQVQVLAQ